MINFDKISTGTKDAKQRALIIDDTLYMLAYRYNSNKTFTTRIYKTKDLNKFDLVYQFETGTPPCSFEYNNNSFYVGTAYGDSSNSKDYTKNGSLYRVNLDNARTSLRLDSDNKIIEISENDSPYSVEYDLSNEEKITFKLNLNFDNNMSEKQWQQEYYKIKKLSLMFALVTDNNNVDFEDSMAYFNNILSKKITFSTKNYSSATQYAQAMFSKELDVQDKLFTLVSTKIIENQDEYKTQITLTVNNTTESSTVIPDNNNNTIVDNITNSVTTDSTNNISSQITNYTNNNSKLPQTGRFFTVKNLLQILIIVSIVLLVFLVIKDNKTKNKKI